jgi:hypothetical protein
MDWTWGPTHTDTHTDRPEEEKEAAQINTRIADLLPPYMYKNKHLINKLAIYERRKEYELKQLQESPEYQFIAQVAAFTNENLDDYWQENFNSMIDSNTQTERTITTFDIDNARREAHVLADADVHRWCICADALVVQGDIVRSSLVGQFQDVHDQSPKTVGRQPELTPAAQRYQRFASQDNNIHPPSAVKSARMEVQREYDAQNDNVIRFQDVRNATRLQFFLKHISEASRFMLYAHLNILFPVGGVWKRDMSELRLVVNANLVDAEGEAAEYDRENESNQNTRSNTSSPESTSGSSPSTPSSTDSDREINSTPERNTGESKTKTVSPSGVRGAPTEVKPEVDQYKYPAPDNQVIKDAAADARNFAARADQYKYPAPDNQVIKDAAADARNFAARAAARRAPDNQDYGDTDTDAETYLDAERLHTYIPEVRSYYAQRCHHWFHQIIKSNYDSRPLLEADKWYNKTTWARLHHYYAPVLYGHMREVASVLKSTHPQLNLRNVQMKEALPWLIGKNGDHSSDQRSFLFAKCVALAIRGSQVLSGKKYGLNSTFVRIKSLRRLAMHAWKSVKEGYKGSSSAP